MTSLRELENAVSAEAIGLAIQDAYDGIEWSSSELNLRMEYESIHLNMVSDVSDIKVVDARQLPRERYLVGVESRLACNFDVLIHKRDYPLVENDPGLYIVNAFWNRHYMRGEIDLHFRASINLVIKPLDSREFDIRILSLETIMPGDEHLEIPTRRRRYRR